MHPRFGAALVGAALVAVALAFAPASPTLQPANAAALPGPEHAAIIQAVDVFDVRLSKAGSGTGRITSDPPYLNCGDSCETSLESGEALTLIATPDPGSRFSKWTGFCAGQGAKCKFTLTKDVTTTATFTLIVKATAAPSEAPTDPPTDAPVETSTPAPTDAPTVAPTVAAATPEPTVEPAPSSTDSGTGPIVLLLAIALVGLLGGLGVVLARGRRIGPPAA